MRKIKLSGRELAVIRAIGFAIPVPGPEVHEHCRLDIEDLVDVINGLMRSGYIEANPYAEEITAETLLTSEFETNSSYVSALKITLGFRNLGVNARKQNQPPPKYIPKQNQF